MPDLTTPNSWSVSLTARCLAISRGTRASAAGRTMNEDTQHRCRPAEPPAPVLSPGSSAQAETTVSGIVPASVSSGAGPLQRPTCPQAYARSERCLYPRLNHHASHTLQLLMTGTCRAPEDALAFSASVSVCAQWVRTISQQHRNAGEVHTQSLRSHLV